MQDSSCRPGSQVLWAGNTEVHRGTLWDLCVLRSSEIVAIRLPLALGLGYSRCSDAAVRYLPFQYQGNAESVIPEGETPHECSVVGRLGANRQIGGYQRRIVGQRGPLCRWSGRG